MMQDFDRFWSQSRAAASPFARWKPPGDLKMQECLDAARGRHVIAGRPITAGEDVLAEPPLAFVLHPSRWLLYNTYIRACAQCLHNVHNTRA